MDEFKRVYIKMGKPTIRQKIVIVTANFLLWLIVKFFKDDKDKMIAEMKDVIINAYKAL